MIPWLDAGEPFPPLSTALPADSAAPGLLAATTELTPTRLLHAYRLGIFPWYGPGEPVLWWSPDPRMVLCPIRFRVSTSLRKTLQRFVADPAAEIRVNADFDGVIRACATKPRVGQHGTWITPAVIDAYRALHAAGYAFSVETWHHDRRIGGLYGVAIGAMCYGESMYADRTDASKLALAALCAFAARAGIAMIDCQQQTPHLASLGAAPMPRAEFADRIRHATTLPAPNWRFDKRILEHWLDAPR